MNQKQTARAAERAHRSLAYYEQQVGSYDGENEELLADFLTDLHHWADEQGVDWFEAVGWGDFHHQAETGWDAEEAEQAAKYADALEGYARIAEERLPDPHGPVRED